ncbi:hypothetical protein Hanom_Chr07g00661251 [Helianthus anomalus]
MHNIKPMKTDIACLIQAKILLKLDSNNIFYVCTSNIKPFVDVLKSKTVGSYT